MYVIWTIHELVVNSFIVNIFVLLYDVFEVKQVRKCMWSVIILVACSVTVSSFSICECCFKRVNSAKQTRVQKITSDTKFNQNQSNGPITIWHSIEIFSVFLLSKNIDDFQNNV